LAGCSIPGGNRKGSRLPTDSTISPEAGADSGSVDQLSAFIATLTPEQRERLAELLIAPPVPK